MANQTSNKITKYRKPLNLNIGMIIFAVIFIYIVICIFMYMTSKHIIAYEVKAGSLSTNNIYKAVALRDETVITAEDAGYINYFAREGGKVAAGDLVYAVDESGKLADYIQSGSSGENSLSQTDLSELKTEIVGFASTFEPKNFSSTYDFKYNMQGTVLKLANYNILESIDAIDASGLAGLVKQCISPISGIVVYSTDGYETLTLEQMTKELIAPKDYEKNQLIGNDLVAVGDPVYKLSTNEDWSLVIEVDKDREMELLEAEYVKVRFLKNQETSWGKVDSYTNEAGDIFVKLTFTNSMITFCTDRFVDIELILADEQGLKIPNSSVVEKEFFIVPKRFITKGGNSNVDGVLREAYTEDGTATTEFIETTIYNEEDDEYYVDDATLRIGDYLVLPEGMEKYAISKRGSLIGVYNINKGYADFKQINILYSNDEYSIVQSNTAYGLNVYDYIVLDAGSVSEDELIYE
ncbi:HlyD family efflux transporter periplasmic adaptor subunit [Kineothrix sp. MB12-C1]|uniref:HlyD family efflux transporter periplasmic adaptor subunit n=1 Tax=Kineothrix sp. MB12-C1 TaxID=3070215 RepID=UPI0027D2F3B4|nr:HlyD family efflux transporter periplasmic adaptor subunit [Kineothrix sp. MB12-C1]WMC92771.1 HlyD family efflux transporter periplasmic adaptor subunit [Kineothrix sp. MB12-C1]